MRKIFVLRKKENFLHKDIQGPQWLSAQFEMALTGSNVKTSGSF